MKKKIVKNKEKFYSKLFLYKTFLYNNIEFESEINDEELQAIIKALNIKKRNKRIEYIYDYACNRIDRFYEGKNLCQFKDGQCLNHQVGNCNYKNGCCRICRYQSSKGCVTRNISCKLFYCGKIKENNKIIKFKDLKILKLYTLRQRLICYENFFAHEKTFLNELKIGMLVPHSIGMAYRLIKNSIYVRQHKNN